MAIEVKHAGSAAPFAAGAFAGSAKRGVPQMQIPAWGSGSSASSSTSRRGRSKKTYNELLEEGLTTRPAVTTATKAGFRGPTKVRGINLDGTIDLTPQEIAANAMQPKATSSAESTTSNATPGATWTDDKGNVWTNDRFGVPKVALRDVPEPIAKPEKPTLDTQYPPQMEYVYDDAQQGQLDKLNRSYDEAVDSGKYSASDLIQLKNHVDYEKSKIRPSEKFKRTKPWSEDQDVGKTWVQGDSYVSRDETGKVYKVSGITEDPAALQAKEAKAKKDDFVKRYRELASTEITEYVDEKDKDGKVIGQKPVKRRMTPDEIKAEIDAEQAAISAYDNPTPAVEKTVKVGSEIAEYGKKILGSVRPEEYRADAERVAKETGIPLPEVFAMTRETLLGGDTSQISPAVATARTPYDVIKAIVRQGQSATPPQAYAPATSPKDFKENTGLTIGEIGQALKSRGNLKDSRLDFKGLDPQRRAEIEQENKDLAELAQMTPVELYNMAAQQANEKQTSVAEQLRNVRDYISGR